MKQERGCGARKRWAPLIRCELPEQHWENTGDGTINAHFGRTFGGRWVYWPVRQREVRRAARAGKSRAGR